MIEFEFNLKRFGLGFAVEFWDFGIAWWIEIGPIGLQHTPTKETWGKDG